MLGKCSSQRGYFLVPSCMTRQKAVPRPDLLSLVYFGYLEGSDPRESLSRLSDSESLGDLG